MAYKEPKVIPCTEYLAFLGAEEELVREFGIETDSDLDDCLNEDKPREGNTYFLSAMSTDLRRPRTAANNLTPRWFGGPSWASAMAEVEMREWREEVAIYSRSLPDIREPAVRTRLVVCNPGNEEFSGSEATFEAVPPRSVETHLLGDRRSRPEVVTNPSPEIQPQHAEFVLPDGTQSPKGSKFSMSPMIGADSLRRCDSNKTVPRDCPMVIRPARLTAPNLFALEAANNSNVSGWHGDRENYYHHACENGERKPRLRRAKSEYRITREQLSSSEDIRTLYHGRSRWSVSVVTFGNSSDMTLMATEGTPSYQHTAVESLKKYLIKPCVNFSRTFSHKSRAGNAIIEATGRYPKSSNSDVHTRDQGERRSARRGDEHGFLGSGESSPPWHDKLTEVVTRMSSRRKNERSSPDGQNMQGLASVVSGW